MRAVLCTDVGLARDATAAGVAVVLVGADGAALAAAVGARRRSGSAGRTAIVVGDPADDATWAAAAALAAEVFGVPGVRITSPAEVEAG